MNSIGHRFDFGENWRDFAGTIDQFRIAVAEADLRRLTGPVVGKTFLDIGSGSGLHSLAAYRLGAKVTAIDVDPGSVETTRRVLAETDATIEQRSVFDCTGQYDVVYSWGALHHTGDMWRAVECAARCVKPGGLFTLAVYLKTPLCSFWRSEKRLFNALPRVLQNTAVLAFGVMNALTICAFARRNPVRFIMEYGSNRGMSYWHDIRDWLGGFPYESAAPDEVIERLAGFTLEYVANSKRRVGLLGTGCAEFRFRRDHTTRTIRAEPLR